MSQNQTEEEIYQNYLKEVKENPFLLSSVPPEHFSREMCLVSMQNGGDLRDVPSDLQDEEICLAAVTQNGKALEYVSENLRNPEICIMAYTNSKEAVAYIPEDIRESVITAVNQVNMQTSPHFLDRVGDVLTAVQSTVLPTLPTDIEWDIDKMGNLGNVYELCEPDNFSDRYAMTAVATDMPTTIEASLRYTLDADALEPLVRRRLDNPLEYFTSFDHELLSSWLDLENASMLAFSEQYDKDPSVQNLLHDWPMQDFEQDYALSLNEKREMARQVLAIEDNVQQFCRKNGNDDYLDQYHYCKANIVDDEQHTEIKVTLDFRNGTSGAAEVCLAYATGFHEFAEPQMVVAKVTAEQLASDRSIHNEIKDALNLSIGEDRRSQNYLAMSKSATDILSSSSVLSDWVKECVDRSLPEIGQSALCADLEDGRLFTEFGPNGRVSPKDENTVVISAYDPKTPESQTERDKAILMWSVEENAKRSLIGALVERSERKSEQNQEEALTQKEEQNRKKGRGR